MEEEIKIPLKNKKYIYGILRGSLKNSLIIFVHGFTGHKNEHQFFNGARFLKKMDSLPLDLIFITGEMTQESLMNVPCLCTDKI